MVTEEDINKSRLLLPEHTIFHKITGGNHAQFGRRGDNSATIDEKEQQTITAEVISHFIHKSLLDNK